MSVPVDPGTGLQDYVDYMLLGGATGVHARFSPLYTILSGGLSSDNMDLTAAYAWTGVHSFQTSELKLGDSDASHKYIFAGSDLAADRTVTLPLLAGNDTFVMEAFTQTLTNKTLTTPTLTTPTINGAAFTGNLTGTPTFTGDVTHSGNILLSSSQLYLDGTSATTIRSSAANTIALRTNSVDRVTLSTTALTTTLDIALSSCALLLDGTSATSIRSNAANSIALRTNSTDRVGVTDNGLGIRATGKLFFDGIDGTGGVYFIETSTDVLNLFVAGGNVMRWEDQKTSILGYWNDASAHSALVIDAANSGGGIVTGLQFSSISPTVDYYFKFDANATDPTGGGGAATGRIRCLIGGVLRYIPYY